MKNTDDKKPSFNSPNDEQRGYSEEIMPAIEPVKSAPEKASEPAEAPEPAYSLAGEVAAIAVKTVAIALSVVVMIVCILAVAFPLRTMRIFNEMGMSERAVDFAEQYIARRLSDAGENIDREDEKGNYPEISRTPSLSDGEFTEALYVCANRCEKLMNGAYASGDAETGAYYAERLEKYTRMYLSLNNVAALNEKRDAESIASMPTAALHPAVYSYAHDMRTLNYRARAYLGRTDAILYDNRSNEMGVMTTLLERGNTLTRATPDNRNGVMQLLDDFTDFIGQISEYLDVEFLRAGVINDLSAKVDIRDGENYYTGFPIVSEAAVRSLYSDKLGGNEFSLLVYGLNDITETESGFKTLYENLKCFNRYAQSAADFVPITTNPVEEQLRQLYWLRALSAAAEKLRYTEILLYYNSAQFGRSGDDIIAQYGTCADFSLVMYNGTQYRISEVYKIKLGQYISDYATFDKTVKEKNI